ncbi:tetratricopeptide repeat protein [bacterium]|nr:tetratricopeptide repeat protein [bacterium]
MKRADASRLCAVAIVAAFFAACAGKPYVPVRQAVAPSDDRQRQTFANVSTAALNLHRRAIDAFNAGDYENAARQWRDALRAGVRDDDFLFEVNYNLGVTFLRMNRPILAEQHFRKALALDAGSARALTGLGAALSTQARVVDAQNAYARAITLNPAFGEAHLGVAQLYLGNERPDAAIDTLRAARHLLPVDAKIRSALAGACVTQARVFLAGGRLDLAEQYFAMAVAEDNTEARAHIGLARVQFERGAVDAAWAHLASAREASPVIKAEPADLFEGAVPAVDPAEAIRAASLATTARDRGDDAGAAREYERALRVDPDNRDLWRQLGELSIERLGDRVRGARAVQALWLLGDQPGATALSEKLRADLPDAQGTPSVVSTDAGRGLAGPEQAGVTSAFETGSRVWRRAKFAGVAGRHTFEGRLVDPAGSTVRRTYFTLDSPVAVREVLVFDTLHRAGAWRQEWTVDGQLLAPHDFQLQD